MTTNDMFDELFSTAQVMGIFRGVSPQDTVALCHAAWDAGVTAVEVPVQGEEAFDALSAAVVAGRARGRAVGAGTVRFPDQLRRAADAGARFTVAPGLDLDIVRLSNEIGIPHLPGVATSTDIDTALKAGLTWLKAFPASVLGAEWVRAQLAPFPEVRFIATGGIGADNARGFLDAGCRAVAIGSAFSDPAQRGSLLERGLLPA
ncbi:bifunctional 4-hydroxy-2-oxoglutarate aldolase/2-dehydro-3-deoxy-phosphogluconate aldolase [Allonocardiopsis opalescens]|uniref:2-dehydro-3-deoxyphosphogluconate aldolase/(4S)-4-hydroxy-2-oxoglutarate aldolase n=1 Tax=Allonocardiopsis opalescens TaxID=1144618 RepID=A0A2T0QFD8_9ACTN|nr:bifunctional 4-hydroxy-2-oxoglutarate aldolase/2-dehydro-3-deoxy-phosphogluconate aldolase [Allonocardiopsis opalescens]PRY02563.1 2-dehydro-3-deoxyphosphogluconate aldolase/(4S)-4-hydroxy-2-oxoglutarate aldolase [Allonocardiopsis opalescens]